MKLKEPGEVFGPKDNIKLNRFRIDYNMFSKTFQKSL